MKPISNPPYCSAKGLLHHVTLVTKLLHVLLLHEDIFLSAIFIFRGLILLLVAGISEQPRHIFANMSGLGEYFSKLIFALKHWIQVGRFEYHEPYIRNNYH